MLIVRTPVRISFAGGGTDLPAYYERFGGAVLSASLNKYFYTVLGNRNDSMVQVISSDLRKLETWTDITNLRMEGTEIEIPVAVLKHVKSAVALDLFMASEIPPGTGLGSSASACVSVLNAITTYLHRPMSRHQLAEEAFYIAHHVLGHPVGKQDEYAAAFGGLNLFTFNRDGTVLVEPLALAPELFRELQSNLMLFYTGASHNSWSILNDQKKATTGSSAALEALHEIKELAYRMASSLRKGHLHAFALMLHEGWTAKKRISDKISTSHIDQLYELARRNGALGGKITGAGGGGFLLLYCRKEQQGQIRQAFAAQNVREMSFELDTLGAHVIVNDPFIDGDEKGGSVWKYVPHIAQTNLVGSWGSRNK